MNDCIRNGKPDVLGMHACYNREPFEPTLAVPYGKRYMRESKDKFVIENIYKEIPFAMSMDCKWEERKDSPRCIGCKWKG